MGESIFTHIYSSGISKTIQGAIGRKGGGGSQEGGMGGGQSGF